MSLFYYFFIYLYSGIVHLISPIHPKAALWVDGRKSWRSRYKQSFQKKGPVLWVHCASLGEFEQGRPIIEAFRAKSPDWQVVLTFFSPSGFEIRKNYDGADFIAYLPADTPANARDFLDIIQPEAAIFIKYEFWANYLFELKKRRVITLLASALFRENQVFFRFYGSFWRDVLRCFTHIFVQNAASGKLLKSIAYSAYSVVGDTRIDRVLDLAERVEAQQQVEEFLKVKGERLVLIIGSSWPQDEVCLAQALQEPELSDRFCCIIAPHEPTEGNIRQIESLFPASLRFSRLAQDGAGNADSDTLIIDNVGMLNRLYPYGDLAYIGGGFGKGIHNTLEPAAFGLPILFGPRYQKFEEARHFVEHGGAFSVSNGTELSSALKALESPELRKFASESVKTYLQHNKGATERIIHFLNRR